MLGKSKIKKLTKDCPTPQNLDECNNQIKMLGDIRRELVRIEADMGDHIAEIKKLGEEKARPLKDQAQSLLDGIEVYCMANRNKLTQNGKVKFFKFGNGEVKWRNRPAKVIIRGKDAILEAFKGLGLQKFVRVKEEINKDAILADPEHTKGIKGITIGSEGEDFVVEPYEEELVKNPENKAKG